MIKIAGCFSLQGNRMAWFIGKRFVKPSTTYSDCLRGVAITSYVMLIFLLPPFVYSIHKAHEQHSIIKKAVPIEGKITRSGKMYYKKQTPRDKSGYKADIHFEYVVNGEKYSGSSLKFAGQKKVLGDEALKLLLEEYPVGKKITVYYDSHNPGTAFVEKGLYFGYAAVIICLGAIITVFLWCTTLLGPLVFLRRFFICGFWFASGITCYWYYFTHAPEPASIFVIITCAIYIALGFGWVFLLLRKI
jgi:hypothetical protein